MDQPYAVITSTTVGGVTTHTVVNVAIWDGAASVDWPAGASLIQSNTAQVGDTYDPTTGVFAHP